VTEIKTSNRGMGAKKGCGIEFVRLPLQSVLKSLTFAEKSSVTILNNNINNNNNIHNNNNNYYY
jgi:hypothetical protein